MDRFAVIGMGRFGTGLAVDLAAKDAEVIAIDLRRDIIEQIRDQVTLAVALDATDPQALTTQGIDKVDVAVVGIGQDFEANALVTATLKQIGVNKVYSRAGSAIQARILTRIGADGYIFPEAESADRWAHRLTMPYLMHKIELGVGHSLVELQAPDSLTHKTLVQLDLRRKYNVNLVAIRRQETIRTETGPVTQEQIISVPMPDSVIQPGDVLLLVGADDNIARLPRD